MNFSIPDEKEIRTAFSDGEEAVVALFGGVSAQFEELAAQLEKQAEVLKDLQGCRKTAETAGNRLPATDTANRTERTA